MIPYPTLKLSRRRTASLAYPSEPRPNPRSRIAGRPAARALLVLGKLLELVRCQVGVNPPGRNLRNSLRPHLHLSPAGGQLQHDAVEDVVLLVAQQSFRPADLLPG